MAEEKLSSEDPEAEDLQRRKSAPDTSATDTSAKHSDGTDAPHSVDGRADPLARLFPHNEPHGATFTTPDFDKQATPIAPQPYSQSTLKSDPGPMPQPDIVPAPISPARLNPTTEMDAVPLPAPVADMPQPEPTIESPAAATPVSQVLPETGAAAPGVPVSAQPSLAPQSSAPQSSAPRQVVSLATVTGAAQQVQIPAQAASVQGGGSIFNTVRCRQCGKSALSELTLCPHCGRELKPAPSRWLTVGLPVAIGLLLVTLLALQAGSGPLGIVSAPVRALGDWVAELSASLDPQVTVIPSGDNAGAVALREESGVVAAAPADLPVESGDSSFADVSDVSLIGPSEEVLDSASSEQAGAGTTDVTGETTANPETSSVTNPLIPDLSTTTAGEGASQPLETLSAVTLPTETAAPSETPTSLPTETPAPTETPLPTDTPAPTNTPLPATYTVVSGDTALGIAARLGVNLDELIAYNNMSAAQAAMLQPGQVLQIPGGVVTPNTEAGETTYLVRQGDTLVTIAQRNGLSVTQLMAANGLSQNDAFTLRPGQTLILPGPTPTPAATASPTAEPTTEPTAQPATAAPTSAPAVAPTATSGANVASLRVTAPKLRAPISGVSLSCNVEGRLQWNPSPDIEPADNYRVHLGFVSGRDEGGNLRITWLVEQAVPSTQTQLALDRSLCGTAPDDLGGQWRWYVDVVTDVNGTKAPVSTPSEIWGFAWQ